MIFDEVPDPAHARAIEQYLILGIDHGFNASTFVSRAVTSTGADLGAAVVAALGSLSGPLHGGAPSRALDTLDAIGTPDRTEAWVRDAVAKGDRIIDFDHGQRLLHDALQPKYHYWVDRGGHNDIVADPALSRAVLLFFDNARSII